MATDSPPAAIRERLDRLRLAYREAFPPERAGGCGVCVLEADAWPYLDGVVAAEVQGEARLDDSFLALQSGGAGGAAFAKTLGAELAADFDAQAAVFAGAGVTPADWTAATAADTLAEVVRTLAAVFARVSDPETRLTLYLRPADVRDADAYARQLTELLLAGLPSGLILLLPAEDGDAVARALGPRADLGVTLLRPRLDADALPRELAAAQAEQTQDPQARFRLHFVDLAEHGGRRAFARMREAGEAAVALCGEHAGWEHLRAAVFTAQGGHLLASKPHRELSLAYFGRGVEAARDATAAANPSGPVALALALQAHGAGLVHLGRYGEALACYDEAVAVASASADLAAFELEARRMRGLCLDQDGRPREAFGAYEETLDAAEPLESEVRRASSLPYVGAEILALVDRLGRRGERGELRDRIERLLGPDWDAHLEPAYLKRARS